MEENDAVLKALQDCDSRLRELKEDEVLVSEAEDTFARLADTVDTVLQERRVSPDRRAFSRATHDRRRHTGDT